MRLDYDKVLETYPLDELFEYNDLTEAEVLEYLIEQGFLSLPEMLPVDVYD